jgi:hypothetical protein
VAYHLLTPDSQSVVITVIVPPTPVSTVEYRAGLPHSGLDVLT